MSIETGVLYVVATPIGNLSDITQRAQDTLRSVDLILAEDTRRTGRLLESLAIRNRLQSLHEHNEEQRLQGLLRRLSQGQALALVSDAGTPLISDPGFRLVRGARGEGYRVVPIPGPSSLTAALSAAGLPTDRFAFEGFLPARRGARRRLLEALSAVSATLVFFETGARLAASLADMGACLGLDRQAVIAKEISKLHEHFQNDTLAALKAWVEEEPQRVRGEFVVVVAGRRRSAETGDAEHAHRILRLLLEELPAARAAALTAKITGGRKRDLYAVALELEGR